MNLQEINDISRHLDQRITEQLMDQMDTLARCGHPPVVGCAVALAAAQHLLESAIGMWVLLTPDHRRDKLFEKTLEKVTGGVRDSAPRLLAIVRKERAKRE